MICGELRSRFEGIEETEFGTERVLWRRGRQEFVENEELGRCGGVMDRLAFTE